MKRVALACALALGSTAAMAQTTGFYFDANLGVSKIHNLDKGDFDIYMRSSS